MAGTNVIFAGNSLQTTNIITAEVEHTTIPAKDVKAYALAHADASKIPFVSYPNRTVKVSGNLIGTSIANLDALIDTFKGYFTGTDQNLDIDYNGTTRRYIATVNTLSLSRPGNLFYAKFSIEFICTNPFGINTSDTTALTASGRTLGIYNDNYTFLGSAPYQLPVATITPTALSTSSTNLDTNPGIEVDTSGYATAGYGGSIARVTTQFHGGVASLQTTCAAGLTNGYYGGVQYTLSGLTIGAQYIFSVWMKGNAGAESINMYAAASVGSVNQTVALTTGWVQYSLTFTAATTAPIVILRSNTASAVFFADDFSVVVNASSYIQWGNGGNGQMVTVQRVWTPSDVLVIDANTKSVTVNGAIVAFTGAFPEFPPGAQVLQYGDGFITRAFNITVTYAVRYL